VGVGRIALAGPSSAVPPPPDPPPGTQFTSASFIGEGLLGAVAGGLANNELIYTAGLLDFRADNDLLVTTANGAVSALTSGQGFAGTITQPTAANQPAHSGANDTLSFTSASATDEAAGDWLQMPSIATRHQSGSNVVGIFYLLLRVPVLPMARTATLIRVGANSGVYTREYGRSHALILGSTGGLNIIREGDTSGTYQQVNFGGGGLMNANVWTAVAWTLNRSGGSTSFMHAKAKSGNLATMQIASTTAATSITADASTIANINRNRWGGNANSGGFGTGWEMHSIGYDAVPPTADNDIQANCDRLLARVA
jgi:hypothetical protein